MCHCRALNNQTNKILEPALGLIYQNSNCSFTEPMDFDSFVKIHQQNLHELATLNL